MTELAMDAALLPDLTELKWSEQEFDDGISNGQEVAANFPDLYVDFIQRENGEDDLSNAVEEIEELELKPFERENLRSLIRDSFCWYISPHLDYLGHFIEFSLVLTEPDGQIVHYLTELDVGNVITPLISEQIPENIELNSDGESVDGTSGFQEEVAADIPELQADIIQTVKGQDNLRNAGEEVRDSILKCFNEIITNSSQYRDYLEVRLIQFPWLFREPEGKLVRHSSELDARSAIPPSWISKQIPEDTYQYIEIVHSDEQSGEKLQKKRLTAKRSRRRTRPNPRIARGFFQFPRIVMPKTRRTRRHQR